MNNDLDELRKMAREIVNAYWRKIPKQEGVYPIDEMAEIRIESALREVRRKAFDEAAEIAENTCIYECSDARCTPEAIRDRTRKEGT